MLEDSLYLDNIEEYVQDESKIVTYKWLSRYLEVPANTAKRMLYSYVSRCQNIPSAHQLSVTYLVTGISNNQGHEVCIVEESDLEDTKKKFAALLGVHIYSVQKNKLKESCSLYTADYDIDEEHISDYSRWSPIECSMDVRKVVAKDQKSISQSESTAKPPLPTLSHMERTNNPKQDISLSQVVKKEKPKQTTKVSTSSKPKPPVKGSMMSFFGANSSDKQKAPPPKKIETKPLQPQQKPKKSSSQACALIASKPVATSPKKDAPSSERKTTKSKKASGLFDGLNDSDIDDEDSEEEKPQPKQAKPLRQRGKKNSRTTQGAKQDKNDLLKKRRRVQELSSDEEPQAMESDVKSESVKTEPGGKRRKKVRRLVPNIYTNAKGEMVTERSWEMVSTDTSSEEDSAPTVSKKAKVEPKSEREKVSPKKTKQATLMNFFKK